MGLTAPPTDDDFDEVDEILDRLEAVEDKLAEMVAKVDAMHAAALAQTQAFADTPASSPELKRRRFGRK